MRRRNLLGILSLAAVVSVAFGNHSTPAAEKVPSQRLLPSNVYAYVTFPSIPELKQRWSQSLLGELAHDRELADFWRDVEVQWREVSAKIEEEIGVNLNDLLAIPSGEVSIAVMQLRGKEVGIVGFLDFGDNGETVDVLLEKSAKALDEQGGKRTVQEFEETQIVVYQSADKQETEEIDADHKKFAYFLKDSYFVAASHVEILGAVLSRWDGKHPQTFAENEVYRYIVDRCKNEDSEAVMTWYVNPVSMVTAALEMAAKGNDRNRNLLSRLPMLGITQLKAIGGSFDMAAGDFDSISRALLYVDFPASGVLNMLQFPATEQLPPKWVSAKSSTYVAFNWDIGRAYAALETLVDSFLGLPGMFANIVNQMAENENGSKVHLKKDIIDHLKGTVHLVGDFVKSENEDRQRERILIALGTKNAGNIKTMLSAIVKTSVFPIEVREFRGETVYELSGGIPGNQNVTLGFGVVNGHLMIASDVAMLEQVIRADKEQESLSESAAYRKIARKFPEKTSILSYQHQNPQFKAVYDLVSSGQAGLSFQGLDFTKLPPFSAIAKYLPAAGSYAVPDKHGALIVSFRLRDGQKK